MGGRSGSGRIRVNGGVVGRAEFESRDGLFFVGEGGGLARFCQSHPLERNPDTQNHHPLPPSPTTPKESPSRVRSPIESVLLRTIEDIVTS